MFLKQFSNSVTQRSLLVLVGSNVCIFSPVQCGEETEEYGKKGSHVLLHRRKKTGLQA